MKKLFKSTIGDTDASTPRNSTPGNMESRMSRSGSLLDNKSSMLSNDSSFISENGSEGKTFKGRKITNPNIKLVDKSQWKENLKCCVCSRVFDKLKGVMSHHCRVCGAGVCGDCSKTRINDQRACDICFFKEKIEVHARRREGIIQAQGERIVKAQAILQKRLNESTELNKSRQGMITEVSSSGTHLENTVKMMNQENNKLQAECESKKKKVEVLRRDLETRRSEISTKELRLRELTQQIENLKKKVSRDQIELKQSREDFQNRKAELEKLQVTKSEVEEMKRAYDEGLANRNENIVFDQTPENPSDREENHLSINAAHE